jgi:hypothetical protein
MYEEFYLLAYNAESQTTFRKNMSPPSSGSKNKPRSAYCLLVSCVTYSSTLKMEATYSSKT